MIEIEILQTSIRRLALQQSRKRYRIGLRKQWMRCLKINPEKYSSMMKKI